MSYRAGFIAVVCLLAACRGPKSAADESPTVARNHRKFVDGCSKKPATSPEYCECAWGEFANLFTEEEMTATDVPPGKLEQFKANVISQCAGKLPEETVRAGYTKGCTSGRAEFDNYCDCTWTELRKTFSPAELAESEMSSSPRFKEAKIEAVNACQQHIPEVALQETFIATCTEKPGMETFCGCAWKALRQQISLAQLQTDDYDQKTVFANVEAMCGKHRPH